MSVDNPLWGAPRIHGELLKLGSEIAQSSVAKYMVQRRAPPSQGWRTFLRNHAPASDRTHRSLNKDAPVTRPVQRTGVISSRAILGGLHYTQHNQLTDEHDRSRRYFAG
jgi:hypothetical protein